MRDSLGIYISVPFCRAKCTYCNFASGVFGAGRIDGYVDRVCAEVREARSFAQTAGAELPEVVDSIYLGGGTPSLLAAEQVRRLFEALRSEFALATDAEVTLECAPGQLEDATLDEFLRQGLSRVSFGVQSFVDAEAKAVGRLHNRTMCLDELRRMRGAGIDDLNVDLIVGLPGQTAQSWRESVEVALETGVPHVSVYMLEVDEDSRLGRELLADGGKGSGSKHAVRYGADAVPSEDAIADWYGAACEWLEAGRVRQYEISNFARMEASDRRSRHNMRYWRREPYLGFGLDAHSMLRKGVGGLRWANPDELASYEGGMAGGAGPLLVQLGQVAGRELELIGKEKAFEETMFLGLRMNEGVDLEDLRAEFGEEYVAVALDSLGDVEEAGLAVRDGERVKLTARGRMASNEVFGRLLVEAGA